MSKSAAFSHWSVLCVSTPQLLCGQTAKSLAILSTKMQMKVAMKLNVNKPNHMCTVWVVSVEGACFFILYSFFYMFAIFLNFKVINENQKFFK